MTLEITLQNAISGLQTSKQSLQVIANNIANSNVEGYTRKTIDQTSRVIDGRGFGVELSLTSRNVDQGVLKQLRKETGELERLSVRETFFSQVNAFFGRPEDNNSISHLAAEVASTLDSLGTTPETAATQFITVKTMTDLANELDRLSTEAQRLRSETNSQITSAISQFNSAMDVVVKTNFDIIQFQASRISTAELEDQRDQALNKMAEIMDITFFQGSDTAITVFSGTGQTLVDGQKQALSYNQPSAMAATLEYVPTTATNFVSPTASSGYPASGIPGIFVGTASTETDITARISSGRLKALVDMRDTDLQAIQAQLDELGEKLKEELNKVHNQGTGFPSAASLTGDRFVTTGTDISASTGLVRIAVVNESGTLVESQVLDLGNAAYTDVNSLLTNGSTLGINDLFTNLGAAVNSSGRLVLTATGNGNRIAINELTSSLSAASDLSRGFSDFFGLNNVYSSAENFSRYRSDAQTSSTSAVVVTGGTLSVTGSFGTATATISANDTLTSVAATINGTAALTTAGISAQVVQEGGVFRLEVSDTQGDEFAMTGGGSLFTDTGLRSDQRGISSRMAVRTDIQNDAFLISRGELQSNTFQSDSLTSDTTTLAGLGRGAGTLSFTINATTTASIAYATTDTLQSVVTSINNDATLIAQNISAEVLAVGSNFQLKIVDGDSDNIHIADSNATGLNIANTQGTSIGDGSIADAMAAVFESTITFNAAPQGGNGLAQTQTTLATYSANILSFNSAQLSTTSTDLQFQESLQLELFNKNASISGVNIDEELANMIIFEQAYLAAARVIDVTQQLFRALQEIV